MLTPPPIHFSYCFGRPEDVGRGGREVVEGLKEILRIKRISTDMSI